MVSRFLVTTRRYIYRCVLVQDALLEGLAYVKTNLRVFELEFSLLQVGVIEPEVDIETFGLRTQAVLPHLGWASIVLEDDRGCINYTVFEDGAWNSAE